MSSKTTDLFNRHRLHPEGLCGPKDDVLFYVRSRSGGSWFGIVRWDVWDYYVGCERSMCCRPWCLGEFEN
jgi:hypothetical protein